MAPIDPGILHHTILTHFMERGYAPSVRELSGVKVNTLWTLASYGPVIEHLGPTWEWDGRVWTQRR